MKTNSPFLSDLYRRYGRTSDWIMPSPLGDLLKQAQKEIEEMQAKLDYVHSMGLRFGMMTSSDKPDPYLMHTWIENCHNTRMFNEWSESIGWKEELAAVQEKLRLATVYLECIAKPVDEGGLYGEADKTTARTALTHIRGEYPE